MSDDLTFENFEIELPEEEPNEDLDLADGDEVQEEPEQPEEQVEEEISEPEEEVKAAKKESWVNNVRKEFVEAKKENQKLKAELKRLQSAQVEQTPVLPEEPSMDDFYTEEDFKSAHEEWVKEKIKVEEFTRQKNLKILKEEELKAEQKRKVEEDFQKRLDGYMAERASLKLTDLEEAELIANEVFSPEQKYVIVKTCKKPALMTYALGKNAEQAKKLASMTDIVDFTFALSKLEDSLKPKRVKPETSPERIIASSPGIPKKDATLERLRREAERTGDFTNVLKYKLKMRDG